MEESSPWRLAPPDGTAPVPPDGLDASKRFLLIDRTPGCGPLVVKLPANVEQLATFRKAVSAAEQHDDQVPRDHGCAGLAVLDHFRLALGGKNQAIASARGAAGLYTFYAVGPEQLVRIPQQVTLLSAGAGERDLALFCET